MPRVCTVCSHGERGEIDRALVAGEGSIRSIARRYCVSNDAVLRHREHLPAALAKAQEMAEIRRAGTLMGDIEEGRDRAERLYCYAEQILERALAAKDLKTALNAVRAAASVMGEARAYAELRGRATGELDQSRDDGRVAVLILPTIPSPESGVVVDVTPRAPQA